jgi:hypothetical protein
MNRFRLVVLAFGCFVLAGCVEGEATYTINPDGSAKVKFDVVTVKQIPFAGGGLGGKAEEDKDLDDLVRDALQPILQTPGVAAWKDVSAEYLPNGKLKLSGTAYVRRLQDFNLNSPPLLAPEFTAEAAPNGALKLSPKEEKESTVPKRKRKSDAEIKKMTDAELDKYIHRELIDLQSMRPLFVAVLGGAKMKMTYVLPGEPDGAKGFVRNGRSLTHTLEGDKVIAVVDRVLKADPADRRKLFREDAAGDIKKILDDEFLAPRSTITIAKPEQAFDYEKEVKAARDAYPALRKKFGLGADVKLPMTDGPPKK